MLVIIALGDAIVGTVPAVCSGGEIDVEALQRRPDPRRAERR